MNARELGFAPFSGGDGTCKISLFLFFAEEL
jgi:hypothetical protein